MFRSMSPDFGNLMKSTVLLLLLATVGFSDLALARPRSAPEAEAAAQTWVQEVLTEGRQNVMVRDVEPFLHEDQIVAYIVHLAGGGFCLTGADDLCRPVVFYHPDGEFEPDNPGLIQLLEEIRDSLLSLRQIQITAGSELAAIQDKLDDRTELWSNLVAGRKPFLRDLKQGRDIPDYLVLPLTSEWRQSSPYNDDCPTPAGPPNDMIPSKVGCVATAMSQVMYYWKWPSRGDSSRQVLWPVHVFDTVESTTLVDDPGIDPGEWAGRLEWTDLTNPPTLRAMGAWDGSMFEEAWDISTDTAFRNALSALRTQSYLQFQVVEADFTTSHFNWDLMQDTHTDSDGLDEGDAQVAMLCFNASVAVDMNWGRFTSIAFTSDVPGRMVTYFRYDPDMTWGNLPFASDLSDEISWYRPVIIRGSNSSGGGHAWVIFGYDFTAGQNLYMMNMGWGSSTIGWYLSTDIPSGYNTNQATVTKIAPEYSVRFVATESIVAGDGTPSTPYRDLAGALADAPDEVTLIFQAGSTHLVSGTMAVLDKPQVYKGSGVLLIHE